MLLVASHGGTMKLSTSMSRRRCPSAEAYVVYPKNVLCLASLNHERVAHFQLSPSRGFGDCSDKCGLNETQRSSGAEATIDHPANTETTSGCNDQKANAKCKDGSFHRHHS